MEGSEVARLVEERGNGGDGGGRSATIFVPRGFVGSSSSSSTSKPALAEGPPACGGSGCWCSSYRCFEAAAAATDLIARTYSRLRAKVVHGGVGWKVGRGYKMVSWQRVQGRTLYVSGQLKAVAGFSMWQVQNCCCTLVPAESVRCLEPLLFCGNNVDMWVEFVAFVCLMLPRKASTSR